MVIRNRTKLSSQGRTHVKNKNIKKLNINFDLASLTLMCNYVISENRNVRRLQYINLRNLIDMLDIDRYINDQEKYKRIMFIKRGLEAKLDRNLQDRLMIFKYINGGILDDDIIDIECFKDMSTAEIDWINETVSAAIKYSFIYERADYMLDLWTRFKSADYRSISSISSEIEEATTELNTLFRKAKVESIAEQPFNLTPQIMESMIIESWNAVTSSFRQLKTGMQGFNQLLGGGFENTRVYLLLGVTGVGKSMTLIDIAYQIKKYNKEFKPKDPTKRPCVVYLTMENTITETIQRLFQICTGEEFSRQSSPQEAIAKMRETGELYLSGTSPIDILVKFKPNRSEDTGYLYTLVEDLEDEGYEVIALLQDHAKRIRSTSKNQDIRLELGDVINEMKVFTMLKDIPLITNSHLNRDGARVIDQNTSNTKADLTRLLGKSNIGESLLMLDNVDVGIIINTEYDGENNKWLVCKDVKTRVKTMREYVCLPYMKNNKIKLVEDYGFDIPVFKDSLYEAPILDTSMPSIPNVARQNTRYTNILPINDEETNIYKYGAAYSSSMLDEGNTSKDKIKPFTITV